MTFEELRTQHPVFTYNGYTYSIQGDVISIQFDYQIGEDIRFQPNISLHPGKYSHFPEQKEVLEGIIFHIGMIELISYWKCACSPTVLVKPYRLNEEQQIWWKKLYWYGLGEFFFKNKLYSDYDHFLNFVFDDEAKDSTSLTYPHIDDSQRVIVPIGGGKDSVVTLEELRVQCDIAPFIINPRGATIDCARIAGFDSEDKIIIMNREIDRNLLELNKQGYLNGHTPFSAMLAFYSLLVSAVTGIRDVALSNESSANEPTIPGTYINHQYSKSLEFEEDFRKYVHDYMGDSNHYFSYLRPLTELQIAEKFAKYPAYFHVFRSCNAGSKENKWCCHCPKCLFAYIILSPFIDDATMIDIFGEDLLDNPALEKTFDELTGIATIKPFECVGTIGEVNEALQRIRETRGDKYLLKHYVNARLTQYEDDLFEDYFNMSMT